MARITSNKLVTKESVMRTVGCSACDLTFEESAIKSHKCTVERRSNPRTTMWPHSSKSSLLFGDVLDYVPPELKEFIVTEGTKFDSTKPDLSFKKNDDNKLRWNLLPIEAVEEVLKVMESGAIKYGDFNWKNAENTEWTRLGNSMERHVIKWKKGLNIDEESGLYELAHIVCNALMLLTYKIEGLGIDNRDLRIGTTKNGCKIISLSKILGSHRVYNVECPFCSKEFEAFYNNLQQGNTGSCGCKRDERLKELNTTHGMSDTKVYNVWLSMRRRCSDPNTNNYHNYGGRGISVCERWQKFENFYEDMGDAPPGKQIDRIDNNGNYEPENCKWSTPSENMQNTRRTKK